MDFNWITPEQAAELWEITERQVQSLCAQVKVSGVVRFNRVWLIPKNALRPIDDRTKVAKQKAQSEDKE